MVQQRRHCDEPVAITKWGTVLQLSMVLQAILSRVILRLSSRVSSMAVDSWHQLWSEKNQEAIARCRRENETAVSGWSGNLFVIAIEYPRHVLTFTWAKCPMTGVPQKEPAQPRPPCHQTAQRLLPKSGLEKAKQKRSILFRAGLWLRQEIEAAIICPWEEMPFWQWCSYIEPLALSQGRTTWLHVMIDRRGRLQALCSFYLEKYAGTIFHLCGTSKGRAGERGEGGSREMENSRRAGFSLLCYANKASKHDSETELINLILISQEGSFLLTWQYIHALQWRQITLCKWESCQFIFITYLPPHHQHMIVWQLNNA